MNEKSDDLTNATPPNSEQPADAERAHESSSPEVAELKAKNAELQDKFLRANAELENFRRRSDREKGDVMKYAITAFAGDVITIGDNLRRAIEAVHNEPSTDNPALKTLLEGIEVTERELIKVFERHGVTRFEPLGEKFDPHYHEAMLKMDVPNAAADTVVKVLQAGYKISERVLRPAAVIVAKGGTDVRPKPSEKTPETAGANAGRAAAEPDIGMPGNLNDAEKHTLDAASNAAQAAEHVRPPQARREKGAGEKRTSTVTTPVTDGSQTPSRDDFISTFGKRMENGS